MFVCVFVLSVYVSKGVEEEDKKRFKFSLFLIHFFLPLIQTPKEHLLLCINRKCKTDISKGKEANLIDI